MNRSTPGALLLVLLVASSIRAQTAVGQGAAARGDSLMAAFRTADALAAYRAGLEGSPEDPTLLWKTARTLTNLAEEEPGDDGDEARYEEAVELARRAVRLAPGVSRTHATLATALGKLALFRGGREKVRLAREVKTEAETAARLDPADFAPFTILGVWNREIATLNPFLKAVAEVALGGLPPASLEKSAESLERAVRIAPDYVVTHYELARTYAEMDRDAAARAELGRALDQPAREELDRLLQDRARVLSRKLGG